ncbi:hypothetical protein U472_00385 [Orenia metallireducens]|jgi:hypothetical protein|uniref:Uncharacterized protein n=1 Tax=Orenia metallireducens TaxID=1413210 RepID=A0A1C0ADF3_9FIRM|nr:hypothetical protein [Orenia metallireducens]OCL28648.1 hypothetical protein U472_00385 [Orenia metallireducens]
MKSLIAGILVGFAAYDISKTSYLTLKAICNAHTKRISFTSIIKAMPFTLLKILVEIIGDILVLVYIYMTWRG